MIKAQGTEVSIFGTTEKILQEVGSIIVGIYDVGEDDFDEIAKILDQHIITATILGNCDIDEIDFTEDEKFQDQFNEMVDEIIKAVNMIRQFLEKKGRGK